jgi:hypothetical protein
VKTVSQIDSQVWFQRIFHPSDFSDASNVAFVHALKLAVLANGRLTILHAGAEGGGWRDFPSARRTLERLEMLPPDSPKEAIFSRFQSPRREFLRSHCGILPSRNGFLQPEHLGGHRSKRR